MSKSHLRKDKTCLNCRHVVENRFCPNCGQENTETRKTFHHLFFHFIEDLTHYENAFWKTIRHLLFKPASLTKEYLSGKRLSYLAPVRLYIFISFITFFLISLFPSNLPGLSDVESKNPIEKSAAKKGKNIKASNLFDFGIKSVKELDSIQKFGKEQDKYNPVEYWILKRGITVIENNTGEEIIEKGKESFIHNFPKVLLLYMPLFAFFLWIFHGKKRWYYFDHGIFTLHYFSFLLLINLILFIIHKTTSLMGDYTLINFLTGIINAAGMIWMFYYFFPAHHRFYGETRMISFLKASFLFFLNTIFILILLFLFLIYTLINIH